MSNATANPKRLYIAEWDEPGKIAELIAGHAFEVQNPAHVQPYFTGGYRWVQLTDCVYIDAPWVIGNDECAAGPIRQVVHLDDPDAGEITVEVILSDTQDADDIRRGEVSYDVNRID